MKTKMSIFGVGDKAGIPAAIYLGIVIYLSIKLSPMFAFPAVLNSILLPKGIFLLVVGGIIQILAAGHLAYSYYKGKLAKTGLYKLMANPLYANPCIALIPGIALVLNSWLVLTASIFLYLLYRKLVAKEYDYLKETFGNEYEDYYKTIFFKWL